MTQEPSPPPARTADLDMRSRSVQVAFAFLLGAGVALLGVRLAGGRFTRPLDASPGAAFRLDLNTATAGELSQLPGVGSTRANHIVNARPFADSDDISRVPGMGSTTVERLRPLIDVGETASGHAANLSSPTLVDPNLATNDELQRLPGIGPKMAQRIIDERRRGGFAKPEDLRRVYGIGPKTLEKIRPYLRFSPESGQ